MAVSTVRTRPLVAVLSRVPLFVEALRAAFEGIADVQSVSANDVEAHGLVRAFRPDVVIIEGADSDPIELAVPCIRVSLEAQRGHAARGDRPAWTPPEHGEMLYEPLHDLCRALSDFSPTLGVGVRTEVVEPGAGTFVITALRFGAPPLGRMSQLEFRTPE